MARRGVSGYLFAPALGKRLLTFGLLWIVLSGTEAGCGAERTSLAGAPATPPSQQTPPANAALPEAERPSVPRLQKPEKEPPKRPVNACLLDYASSQVPVPSDSQVAARIRATVNGAAILDDEVREAIYPELIATQNLAEPERTRIRKERFEKALQQLIEREVVLQDMFARLEKQPQVIEKLKTYAEKEFDKRMNELRKRSHIKSDEEFKAFLRMQGLTLAGVRRQIERNFMAMEYMRNRILPALDRIGPEQIREYYEKHPEEFQVADRVTWQDIFIDAAKYPNRAAAQQFAQTLAARARAHEDFLKLVTQYDQGDSSYRNGEGYGNRRDEIKPPEAEPILFRLRDGEVGPVVGLTNGFHVIRLVKRDYAGRKPFDEKTQAAIRNKLGMEAWEREYKRILADLKRKAEIQISSVP